MTARLAADLLREAVGRPSNRVQFTSLSDITNVRPDGDREIVVELSQRSAFLPEDLELPLAVGPAANRHRPLPAGRKREPSEIVLRTIRTLLRGDAAHRGSRHQSRSGRFATAWASLLRGEVDMVTDVPPDAVEFIENDDVDVISLRPSLSVSRLHSTPGGRHSTRPSSGARSTTRSIGRRSSDRRPARAAEGPRPDRCGRSTGPTTTPCPPYTFDPGTCHVPSGERRLSAR